MFFIPADANDVQALFDIFSEAALNNPDDLDDEDDEDVDGEEGGMFPNGFIYNVDEVHSGAQQARLNQWESVFQFPGGVENNNDVEGGDGSSARTDEPTEEEGATMDVL